MSHWGSVASGGWHLLSQNIWSDWLAVTGPLMFNRAVQWMRIFLASGLAGGGIPRGPSFSQPESYTILKMELILLESEKSWHFLTFQLFQLGSMTSWLIFCKMFRIPFGLKNRKLQLNIIIHHSVGAFIKLFSSRLPRLGSLDENLNAPTD